MDMHVRVWLGTAPVRIMKMLMMRVVDVRMRMLQPLMQMRVFVRLG